MPSLMSSGSATAPPGQAASPSTALVVEFVCLFTHDLKRKQKRWQDGRIKYHTFNKRVMVYDDRGNFVGDMHWRRDWEFGDGEEVELERGGVIVQVAECVGHQQQDLSEIVDKRVREKEERQAKIAARPSILRSMAVRTPMPQPRLPPTPQDNPQTRHRPLQQVIGTPSGHYGRAVVPTESPFEQRQKANDSPADEVDPRPSKRRRYDTTPPSKQGYARSLFGASLTLSAVPLSSAPIRRPAPPQSRPWTETPPPPKPHKTSTSPPTSSPELPSRPAHEKEIPRPSRPASPIREPLRGNAPLLLPDHALQRAADDPIGGGGRRSGPQLDQASRSQSRYTASNPFGAASASVAGAQTSSFTPDHGTNIIPKPARQPTKLTSKKAPCPPLLKTRPAPNTHATKHIIVLDEDEEGEPMAGPGNSVPVISKKQKSTKKTRPPMPSLPTPLESEPGTKSAPAIGAGIAPQAEKRTELRLKPREKRGLLMAAEPPRKVKKAKKSKNTGNPPATVPEPLERTARPHVIDLDAEPSNVAEERRSPFSQDEDLFVSSPPTSKGQPVEELLGNPIRQQSEARPGMAAPLEDPEPPNGPPMEPLVETPNLADKTEFAGLRGTNDQEHGPPRVSSDSSLNICKYPREAKDQISNGAAFIDRAQVVEPSKSPGGGPEGGDTPDMATSSKQPTTNILAQQQVEAPINRKQSGLETESSDEEFPRVPVGPRLARLPRRSIKSREVIGYIPSSSPVPGLPSRGPPDLPVVRHTDQSPERSISPPFPERGEVRPVDDGTHTSRESEPCERAVTNSAVPVQEHTASPSGALEVSCPGSLRDATFAGVLPLTSKSLPPSESREPQPKEPGPDRPGLTSRTTNDDKNSGRIISAPSADPPHALASATDTFANAGLAAAGVSQNGAVSAVEGNKAQAGPAGQLDDPGPIPNTASLSRSVERTSLELEEKTTDTSSGNGSTNPPRRIANPATRGRKAALKSHAAGQVPQSILPPPDPVLPRSNLRPLAGPQLDSAGNDRPKRKMHFPGFVSAKEGGPWSKEADDLLGIGRPAP